MENWIGAFSGTYSVLSELFPLSPYFCLSYCEMFDEIELQAAKIVSRQCSTLVGLLQRLSKVRLVCGGLDKSSSLHLFYSALGPGNSGRWMQQKGQATVTAAEANVILSIEPSCCFIMGRLFWRGDVDARSI
jgi:hypothetical protein